MRLQGFRARAFRSRARRRLDARHQECSSGLRSVWRGRSPLRRGPSYPPQWRQVDFAREVFDPRSRPQSHRSQIHRLSRTARDMLVLLTRALDESKRTAARLACDGHDAVLSPFRHGADRSNMARGRYRWRDRDERARLRIIIRRAGLASARGAPPLAFAPGRRADGGSRARAGF